MTPQQAYEDLRERCPELHLLAWDDLSAPERLTLIGTAERYAAACLDKIDGALAEARRRG